MLHGQEWMLIFDWIRVGGHAALSLFGEEKNSLRKFVEGARAEVAPGGDSHVAEGKGAW